MKGFFAAAAKAARARARGVRRAQARGAGRDRRARVHRGCSRRRDRRDGFRAVARRLGAALEGGAAARALRRGRRAAAVGRAARRGGGARARRRRTRRRRPAWRSSARWRTSRRSRRALRGSDRFRTEGTRTKPVTFQTRRPSRNAGDSSPRIAPPSTATNPRAQSLQYRFGFQLGIEQLESRADLRRTFPVPGGRPAFWGSRVPGNVPGNANAPTSRASGRRPFVRATRARRTRTTPASCSTRATSGTSREDGERLDGSDADDEDEEGFALTNAADEHEDDEHEEGFVVPDGTSPRRRTRGGRGRRAPG